MRKKAMVIMLIMLVASLLGGCWNYRGLDQMSIVAGLAIDRNESTGGYKITFEIVDMTGNVKQQGVQSMILESTGETLFDAVRQAKRRIVNKVYFGHMETVVISEEIARNVDIGDIIDFFMRDAEVRETLSIVVSQEANAHDLIAIEGIGHPLLSFEIKKIIREDNKVTSSTPFIQLYNIHETLHEEGLEVVLPVFHNTDNHGKPVTEANGTAIFKSEKLIGFLTPEQSKWFLFIMGNVEGGVLTFSSTGQGQADTTLEISKNTTQRSFEYKDGQLMIVLKVETDTYLDEADTPLDSLDEIRIGELERLASEKLMQGLADTIDTVQAQYNSDIFGFGSLVHKKDMKLWNTLKDQWDELFPVLEVRIECKVNIVNTASVKEQ